MADHSQTTRIAFRRNGAINRDGYCLGWIERNEGGPGPYWRVRLTPASGKPGLVGEYERLSDAKAAARSVLEASA